MEDTEFVDRLAAFCRRSLGGEGRLESLRRLSGGASMESWSLDYQGQPLVLRRLPPGMEGDADMGGNRAVPLEAQADLIELASRHGIKAPAVRARLTPVDGLGHGFAMQRVNGEALPHKLFRDARYTDALTGLIPDWATQLAKIHAIDVDELPGALVHHTPAEMVAAMREFYDEMGAASPIFALAFGWLQANLPDPVEPALCHGDFRMGNLLIDEGGISAVLDWELAHLGDPAQDLAYGCTPSWRFGRYDRPVGGIGEIDDLLTAYTDAGGRPVSRARFDFWLIYSCLWWGISCLTMTRIWRSGEDRSLERVVIGRRFSEVEIDLLLLLDPHLSAGPEPLHADDALAGLFEQRDLETGEGDPRPHELAMALGEWAESSLLPGAEGHAKFEIRVAINALGIARRDARWREAIETRSQARLAALGRTASQLHDELSRNGVSALTPAIVEHLRLTALSRCAIDQPRYAGLAKARQVWLASA